MPTPPPPPPPSDFPEEQDRTTAAAQAIDDHNNGVFEDAFPECDECHMPAHWSQMVMRVCGMSCGPRVLDRYVVLLCADCAKNPVPPPPPPLSRLVVTEPQGSTGAEMTGRRQCSAQGVSGVKVPVPIHTAITYSPGKARRPDSIPVLVLRLARYCAVVTLAAAMQPILGVYKWTAPDSGE